MAGLLRNMTVYCERRVKNTSMGYIVGDDPTQFPLPMLLFQISLVTLFSAFFHILLNRAGKISFVPQMLGGIALGPSFLGYNKKFANKLFYPKSLMFIDVYESLGFMLLIFLISVRMDVSIIKKCGRMAVIIGVATFVLPFLMTSGVAYLIRDARSLNKALRPTLTMVASLESTMSFHVIFGILSDLKLLNSELGRLALSSSMISNFCSWLFFMVATSMKDAIETGRSDLVMLTQVSKVLIVLMIVYILRPIMIWMMRRTPEGKPLKESYVLGIMVMIFVCSFIAETTGQHYVFAPIVLGIATPDQPPMGSSLSEKIGCFVWTVLMPCYTIGIGRRVNIYSVGLVDVVAVEFLIILAILAKMAAVTMASFYYRVPFLDALLLGLLMNNQGIFDIQLFKQAITAKLLTEEGFSIMVFAAMVHSAILPSLIRTLYNPSRRYIAYQRRTIQHQSQDSELRILACFHEQDCVPAIINILEVSNPTPESPIVVYALNLEEFMGRSIPSITQHKLNGNSDPLPKKIEPIINAFRLYELQNHDLVTVQCFTAVTPCATMHDDVCSMAVEKSTTLVIIPFQKSDSSNIRAVNKKVLKNAPCSVGILYDRGMLDYRDMLTRWHTMKICVIFIGGPDDREALAYAARMAENPSVRLQVIRIFNPNETFPGLIEQKHDTSAINAFKISTFNNNNVEFREENVTESSQTTQLLRSTEEDYDLMLVGINHDNDSPILVGLSHWSEIEELGVVGDLLASSDFNIKASVLAIQQQASVIEEMVDSPTARYIPQIR